MFVLTRHFKRSNFSVFTVVKTNEWEQLQWCREQVHNIVTINIRTFSGFLLLIVFLNIVLFHQFLPRDAMQKRGLCGHAVCACVCVSVMFVGCIKTNKHSIKIFSPSGSHIILFFSVPNSIAIFRREPPPLTVASNAGGVGRNRDSEPTSGLTACVNTATGQVL